MRGLSALYDPRDLSAFAFLHQPDAENSPHLPIDKTNTIVSYTISYEQ